MKSYKVEGRSTANGISYRIFVKEQGKLAKVVQVGINGKELKRIVRELENDGYIEQVSPIVKEYREATAEGKARILDNINKGRF